MATVNDPENAVQRLHVIMRSSDNPDDQGFLVDMGRELLRVYNECAEYVRASGGKKFNGQAVVIFDFKAFVSEGKEVEVTVGMQPIKTKTPPKTFARVKRTFAGHDGEISTVPTQIDLPIMGIKGSVDGGKKDVPKATAKVI